MKRRSFILGSIVLLAACGSTPSATTTEKTQPATPAAAAAAAPTADIQGTVAAAVAATISAMPKPTAPPTAVPQAPTEVPKPAAPTKPVAGEVKVEVPEFTNHKNSIGGIVISGVLANTGQTVAAIGDIAVSLLGENGATVGSAQAIIKPRMLVPGARSGWQAIASNVPAFKDIKVQVQAKPPSDLSGIFSYQALKVEGITVAKPGPPFNTPKISGQVVNTGQKTANYVTIIATVLDDNGKLLVVANAIATLTELGPGQSSPFELNFITEGEQLKGKSIDKYELFLEGIPKA